MLILSVKAENFRRYEKLRLTNLPQQGVVGIEGPNESGKTTLGDVILFALFGKTARPSSMPVSRLIRWNADRMSVEVEFVIPGKGTYLVYREVDRSGTNYVKLLDSQTRRELAVGNMDVSRFLSRLLGCGHVEFWRFLYLDQHIDVESRRAEAGAIEGMTGVGQIEEAIRGIDRELEQLEREYAHFQKDIQRHRKQIAKFEKGISSLDDLRATAESSSSRLREHERKKESLQSELKRLRRFTEKLERTPPRIEKAAAESIARLHEELCRVREGGASPDSDPGGDDGEALEIESEAHARGRILSLSEGLFTVTGEFLALRQAHEESRRDLLRSLDPSSDDSWGAQLASVERELATRKRSCLRLSCWTLLFLILAGLCGGGASLILAETAQAEVIRNALARVHVGRDSAPLVLGSAGAVCGGFFVGLLVVRLGMRGTRRQTEDRLEQLEKRVAAAETSKEGLEVALAAAGPEELEAFLAAAASVEDARLSGRREDFLRRLERFTGTVGEDAYRQALDELMRGLKKLVRDFRERIKELDRHLRDLSAATRRLVNEKNRVASDIREGEANKPRKKGLAEKNEELERKAGEIFKELECRRAARDLLQESAASMWSRLGPTVTRYVRAVLPAVTGDRYRDVKVGSRLEVKLFAREKNDFMELSELSGGTLEGVKLALRLAAAQILTSSRIRQPQFVFLDEPLKMADRARADRVLEILRVLSADVRQVFLVQQEFTPEQRDRLDELIATSVDSAELMADGSTRNGESDSGIHLGSSPGD